ncbi:MAG: nucleotidyltransferase domain-containing protein [Armatimonadota bacterium]|nr:nucleotidyltransferase domain-containing protein [Armatimonadota bacterium]
MDLHEALRQLRAELEELYGERLKGLYLFGSRARGDAEPDSDVDVAVVLDDFDSAFEEIDRMAEVGTRISLAADLAITKIPLTEAQWRDKQTAFLRNARREAVSIE